MQDLAADCLAVGLLSRFYCLITDAQTFLPNGLETCPKIARSDLDQGMIYKICYDNLTIMLR